MTPPTHDSIVERGYDQRRVTVVDATIHRIRFEALAPGPSETWPALFASEADRHLTNLGSNRTIA